MADRFGHPPCQPWRSGASRVYAGALSIRAEERCMSFSLPSAAAIVHRGPSRLRRATETGGHPGRRRRLFAAEADARPGTGADPAEQSHHRLPLGTAQPAASVLSALARRSTAIPKKTAAWLAAAANRPGASASPPAATTAWNWSTGGPGKRTRNRRKAFPARSRCAETAARGGHILYEDRRPAPWRPGLS